MYLRKIGKKWYFTIIIAKENGEKTRIEKVGGYTKKDAEAAAMQILRKQDRFGRINYIKSITAKDFFEEWLHNYVFINLMSNTQDSYESIIKNHFIPEFGEKKLYTINTIFLQKYLNDKRGIYKRATLQKWINLLKSAFRDACNVYDYLDKNPAAHLRLPKYEDMKEEVRPFSEKDIEKIFARFTSNNILYIPIMLAYYTGMRLGECLALTWDDVDFEAKTITVSKNQYDKRGFAEVSNTTKSKKHRTIIISKDLVAILKGHRLQQKKYKLMYGKEYINSNAVCTKKNGEKILSNNMRYFTLWCKENNIKGSFHTFRHTHAVMLLENGCDIDYIAKRLGHSTIRTTCDIYTHITQKRNLEALEIMEKVL